MFLAGLSHNLIAFKSEAMKELPHDFLPALFWMCQLRDIGSVEVIVDTEAWSPPLDIQPVIEALEEIEVTNKDILCFMAPLKAIKDMDPALLYMG